MFPRLCCVWGSEMGCVSCLPVGQGCGDKCTGVSSTGNKSTGKGAGSPAQTEVQLLKELGKAVQPRPRQDRMESLQMFVYYVLSVSPRLTLHSWKSSCLSFLSVGIIGVCHQASFRVFYFVPSLCLEKLSLHVGSSPSQVGHPDLLVQHKPRKVSRCVTRDVPGSLDYTV